MEATFARCLSAALLIALAPSCVLAAPSFALPSACTSGATGSDYGGDSLYGALPPTVSIIYPVGNQNYYVDSVIVQPSGNAWTYTFTPPVLYQTYLVVVTYTPFLQSYVAVEPTSSAPYTNWLPPAGFITNPAAHLLPSISIQLTQGPGGSGPPLPYGFLEMAPDFPLSPPYTLQADANGIVVINCYTSLQAGNPGTVSTSDGYYLYDAVFFPTSGADAEGRVRVQAH